MKFTRRSFVGAIAATAIVRQTLKAEPASANRSEVLHFVDPTIGTGGSGHCYPGATMPFGAVQLSPDTGDIGWKHCSGYHFDDHAILGFSHTHLSGTGGADMLDFRVMPAYSEHLPPTASADDFSTPFSHADETAAPGYYSVYLKSGIQVELTASERAGIHRYTFQHSNACAMIDLQNYSADERPKLGDTSRISWAKLQIQGNHLSGGRSTLGWAKGRELYFAMQCSRQPTKVDLFVDGIKVQDPAQMQSGTRVMAILHFANRAGEKLLIKTSISGVDIHGARNNLDREIPGWNFDETKRHAQETWDKALSRARVVKGGDKTSKQIFYTGLYHSMVAPTLFDDIDGRYRGMDGNIHTLVEGTHNYSTYSFWDTYRALHPMMTLLMPDLVPKIVGCVVRQSSESPNGVLVWPLQGKETGCMDGYHSAPVVAEAIRKGFPGIDAKQAYAVYRQRAMVDDYRGLASYRQYGFVPCDLEEESASKTCDYAYDDWCVAAMAEAAENPAEAKLLRDRSRNYRNLYNQVSGFIQPRYADGHWAEPFNPKAITITKKWRDYTEANAWQTTFLAQHDAEGLCMLLGGRKALETKLDQLFNESSDLPTEMMAPDISGMVGQYSQGNEPSHHIAYLYNTANAPHKAQHRIHQLMSGLYHNNPKDALAGNEDCGQMSAWYCMNAFGFYAVDPVSANYDIGTPLFDQIDLTVGEHRTLSIIAKRESASAIFVEEVQFNGNKITDWKISHSLLAQGGQLIFVLRNEAATLT